MIHNTATINLKSVNTTHDKEGSLIAFGIAEFYYRSKEGIVADEMPFRSKGAPAVVINEQGEGVHGTAEGYLDLIVDNRGEYKEKIATFVIRNFISAQPINELTQVSKNTQSPETPDFAKELLEDNVTSTDEDLDDEPPF
ncbi:hypothetical protein LC653_32970 [Nostoc sp. CHAB 5784]|uniref:hypothetical protein n=1 Tax=Nostoc mirabile TaxID=2907820 RepID=UPI001E2EC47C|nr:hypothetical protein [Nostoc mirabile]MCC5668533.1 hypothetical protein [Nostoc mirabile CHAB5784]